MTRTALTAAPLVRRVASAEDNAVWYPTQQRDELLTTYVTASCM